MWSSPQGNRLHCPATNGHSFSTGGNQQQPAASESNRDGQDGAGKAVKAHSAEETSPGGRMPTHLVLAAILVATPVLASSCRGEHGVGSAATTDQAQSAHNRFAGYEQVVRDTHQASLAARKRVLKDVVAADTYWIKGNWGDVLWCLSALSLSALVNYAYRTPYYLLGSTLQNPALSMQRDSKPVLKYSGISRQNRWSGMLFCDPEARSPVGGVLKERAADKICAVYPEIEKTAQGRPQHPFWSFQHQNVLFLQRITPGKGMGSYSTGRMNIRFHGKGLDKVEENGWIFANNGKAFVAVKFLDGGYTWDETGELAMPLGHQPDATTRVLMHAGDIDTAKSFEAFQTAVQANPLKIEPDTMTYQPGTGPKLECCRYDVENFQQFKLPRVDGKPIDLRPEWTYRSPYLNGRFGEDRLTVTVGPIKRIYDFGAGQIETVLE